MCVDGSVCVWTGDVCAWTGCVYMDGRMCACGWEGVCVGGVSGRGTRNQELMGERRMINKVSYGVVFHWVSNVVMGMS